MFSQLSVLALLQQCLRQSQIPRTQSRHSSERKRHGVSAASEKVDRLSRYQLPRLRLRSLRVRARRQRLLSLHRRPLLLVQLVAAAVVSSPASSSEAALQRSRFHWLGTLPRRRPPPHHEPHLVDLGRMSTPSAVRDSRLLLTLMMLFTCGSGELLYAGFSQIHLRCCVRSVLSLFSFCAESSAAAPRQSGYNYDSEAGRRQQQGAVTSAALGGGMHGGRPGMAYMQDPVWGVYEVSRERFLLPELAAISLF